MSHKFHFIQTGGLIQVQIATIDDILHLDELDQKLWIALTCPVKGLEFSQETLEMLDTDKNGRVRVPEILEAIAFIKKYFKKPEIIMTPGDSIPLNALSDENFSCGHSPVASARSILGILEKKDASEISLADVTVNDKLFSPTVINGDGILPAEAVGDETAAAVVKDIIACTGGKDDISGVKGIDKEQAETFFKDLRSVQSWRREAKSNAEKIFILGDKTDAAAASYMKIRDKVNEFFMRCSLSSFAATVSDAIKKKEVEAITSNEGEGTVLSAEQLAALPLAECEAGKSLPLTSGLNPAWQKDIADFANLTLSEGKTELTETEWREVEKNFEPYLAWYTSRPANTSSSLSVKRVGEILASDCEKLIYSKLEEESKHPPLALATVDLKKMLLYRRDFVELLRNFVSFEDFYNPKVSAVFQCGTLYIDGRSCDLCFRVTDAAKHSLMSPLSQCYLLYCDCTEAKTGEKMQIAAMISAGNCDNLIVGRNGLFYDRNGKDWDATITKIVDNPISIRQAFWSPYKKLSRFIQDKIAKTAAAAEEKVSGKMTNAVADPKTAAASATAATANTKKTDVGTVAAISVAFTGIATVVGGLLQAFLGLGYWIPLGIIGIILAISFPSMFIAWSKLRQRNIAPILDASGWAVNGNVRINIPLGASLTKTGVRPKNSTLDAYDPFTQKKFPLIRVIILLILLAALIIGVVWAFKTYGSFMGITTAIVNAIKNLKK